MSLRDYDYDLTNSSPNFTVNEIYEINSCIGFNSIINLSTTITRRCIWKRYVELTMDEIAEKFNIPVSQLKIKK